MTERLFFAIWPGEQQRSELTGFQQELTNHPGRLVQPEDFHITLVFLGDLVRERRVRAEAAAGLVRAVPFKLSLDRFGCFPRTRVLWCGTSGRSQPLLDLLQSLNGGLRGCAFRPERRRFTPHVTLMRNARPLPARDLKHPIEWPVSRFALVTARSGERPRYRVVREWSLGS